MLPDALLGGNDPHTERQEERHGQREVKHRAVGQRKDSQHHRHPSRGFTFSPSCVPLLTDEHRKPFPKDGVSKDLPLASSERSYFPLSELPWGTDRLSVSDHLVIMFCVQLFCSAPQLPLILN